MVGLMHRRELRGTREASNHYCKMLLTRHYDQRPIDETVCDAIITNGGVKNPSKGCKTLR